MRTLSLKEAKALKSGTILYHVIHKNTDGTPQRWRVSGKVKTWKRDDSKVAIPVKWGLKIWDTLTEKELHLVTLEPFSEFQTHKFDFLSDAETYQSLMRKKGYLTHLDRVTGISCPYSLLTVYKLEYTKCDGCGRKYNTERFQMVDEDHQPIPGMYHCGCAYKK